MIKMRSHILFIGIMISLLVSSCFEKATQATRNTAHISATEGLPEDAIIYALPRTVLRIDVEYEKIIGKKGPFYDHRYKYLGLSEGISEDFSGWAIKDINVNSYNEIDPGQYYIASGLNSSRLLSLGKMGLVMSAEEHSAGEKIIDTEAYLPAEPFYTDLSVKRYIEEYTDTASRLMPTDTGFIRVPYVEIKTRFKNLDDKAEEAANFIIKIRKRRFKLMSGQYDVFPEGEALAYSVRKLTELENEYLALFLGKTVRYSHKKSFEWIPSKEDLEQDMPLFSFSEQEGLLQGEQTGGELVSVRIIPLGTNELLESYSYNISDTIQAGGLIYRVPEVTKISILKGEKQVFSQKQLVYQLGSLIRLPENFNIEREDIQ